MMTQDDSEAFDELVADGTVELVRFDREAPDEMEEDEFLVLAVGRLMLYYRQRYRQRAGIYRNKYGERRKAPVRVTSLENVKSVLAVRDDSSLLWIEIEDFLEGLQCEADGGLSREASSSGGPLESSELESRRSLLVDRLLSPSSTRGPGGAAALSS